MPHADSSVEPTSTLSRQPVLDLKRAIHGYEFVDRSPGAAVMLALISHPESQALAGRKLLFLRTPHGILQHPALELANPANLVLHIEAVADDQPQSIAELAPVLQSLRKRGVKLAFDHTTLKTPYASWWPLAHFYKFDLAAIEAGQVKPLLESARRQSRAQLIACHVDTSQRFQQMQELGVKLFQGDWFAKPAPARARTLQPSQALVMQLIQLLRGEADPREIEELLKQDASMSLNLLRLINSSGMGLSCEVRSLRHAVMILGRKRLFRWAAVLMTTTRTNGSAPAIATMAVARGRLMELLAAELLSPDDCESAFVVGVFSLLDAMLDMPMSEALASFPLPQAVADALLERTGLFAPFLELTEACESGEAEAFAKAADTLHLSNHQINWAHLQALAWAEELAAAT